MRTKVLIIDDSAIMRNLLTEILGSDASIDVLGTATDPVAAIPKIKSLLPDVIIRDVGMPKMDMRNGTVALAQEIIDKVKNAAAARGRRRSQDETPVATVKLAAGSFLKTTRKIIAVGASTGGTEAIKDVLMSLPADSPGVVIVQHMPERFTRSFAERLDSLCAVRVHEAQDGDRVLPGHVLIAPGNFHMQVRRSGVSTIVDLNQEAPVRRHRPSVDVLFHSCAEAIGPNAVGVILTGMGDDGARGMRAMHEAGAPTVAQDEASCVVFGMPREAIAAGAVDVVAPLHEIAPTVLRMLLAP